MVAVDADHVPQTVLDAFVKGRLILCLRRIGAAAPGILETSRAPETIFRPEENPQPVAGVREGRSVGIMRTADEIEAGILDQAYVAFEAAVGHGVAPARMILMCVDPFE